MSRIPEERTSLLGAVFGFYALQEIEAGIADRRARGHREYLAEDKFERDFREYADTYYNDMARWLHDYLAITALGEARHLYAHTLLESSYARPCLMVDRFRLYHRESRGSGYEAGASANPEQFLSVLHEVFSDKWCWIEGYGGSSWQIIVENIQTYYELLPVVFIDNVVDLSHNSGLVFDKDIMLCGGRFGSQYIQLLDIKSHGSIFDVFDSPYASSYLASILYALRGGVNGQWRIHGIAYEVKNLLERAITLGYIGIPYELILGLVTNPDFIFPRIKWGEDIVSIGEEKASYDCEYCQSDPCECDTLDVMQEYVELQEVVL